ncbi:ACT domain-containing protein ACR4-like protein isoform X2 [Tanacetum coccineum]
MEDEYEKFIRRMNPPRVVIDNDSCQNATIIQVDSANKHGILLEVVQVLTDLNFVITKGYISSDGGWFMDGNASNFVILYFRFIVLYDKLFG